MLFSVPIPAAQPLFRFSNKNIFSIGDLEVRILAGFANGLSVICDVTIAAGLCYYFQAGKSGFSTCAELFSAMPLV